MSGATSIAISLHRQPIPITWTIPGLAGAVGGQFSAPSVGACLAAGVALVALGIAGAGAQVMRWLPQPIVMGMFAGSIVGYAHGIGHGGGFRRRRRCGRRVSGGPHRREPRVPPVGIAALPARRWSASSG